MSNCCHDEQCDRCAEHTCESCARYCCDIRLCDECIEKHNHEKHRAGDPA